MAIYLIILVIGLSCCSNVMAIEKLSCKGDEARRALIDAGKLTSWEDVYQSYKKFGHCDDGALAESYDHSIVRILSSESPKLDDLHAVAKSDIDFRKFVVRHVAGAVSRDDLKRILFNLSQYCPGDAKDMCAELANAANEKD